MDKQSFFSNPNLDGVDPETFTASLQLANMKLKLQDFQQQFLHLREQSSGQWNELFDIILEDFDIRFKLYLHG